VKTSGDAGTPRETLKRRYRRRERAPNATPRNRATGRFPVIAPLEKMIQTAVGKLIHPMH